MIREKNQHEKEHEYGQLCYRHGEAHDVRIEDIEHELYISSAHPMNKSHYLSFAACCTDDRFELVRFYPEGNAEARFSRRGHGILYWYCNRHGLFFKRF